ncbi:hybrid sensor histidine kinase/response regulator [Fimbriiglobus ruber]|uniref:histidine kinase n=1 Tax=Fimbriiglobus ruber TaxID=1908690 RepID=A0A225D5T2_9BACT|nr:hybrid sensor histidine kinase/response regulator [Fimbriiglobus ruber]OWK36822.1 sensory box histidine kinase/response regulator [Fimbriiglobus ruber]
MTPATVLVVEDEIIIAKGIERQIKKLGYVVAGTAATGEEAVRKAAELRPDIILMDINLGDGMDGVAAATAVRRESGTPVVFLTAHSDDDTLQRAKLAEPHGYVLKPYEDKDLQTTIEIALYKHQMECRLRENEQWLAATLGSIGDGVIATDARGRVRFLNALAEQLTGWTQADALDRDLRDVFHIVHEKTRRPATNPAVVALEKGESATLDPDTILIGKDGNERPIDDNAAPIRDVAGRVSGAVLVFRDVTERRHLEDHLRQALKMEAIGRLAGGIAHDFNNITTVVTGFCELLLTGDLSPHDHVDAIRRIHEAGTRAAALTRQIMAFSHKQLLVQCALNLNTVVRDMGSMVERLIGADVAFVADLAPGLGPVNADPTQISQVILNLTANARDAMPTGGRLTVATANVELGDETVRSHPDVRPGRYALLSVSDTGTGMPEDVLVHMFEPFFTTKGVGRGTGLGLATVYGIIKQSQGHAEVTSRVGTGTTVRLYLPLIDEPPAVADGDGVRAEKGHETILLVEDDATVRRVAAVILRESGYTVFEASSGLDAIALVERYPDPIHLLVIDLVMPHLPGREAAERLTRLKPGMRVLMISGCSGEMPVQQQEAQKAAADFLPKPFGLGDLTAKVREILDRA